ncbi:PPR27-like protein, partial [Mya arenaria]
MSRRSSLFAKQIPGEKKPKGTSLSFLTRYRRTTCMLRRASLQVDISAINDAGLTPLHHAVLGGNEAAVRLLVAHGVTVNKHEEDSWTPLHAACAEFLLESGADKNILTDEGERPLDLVEPSDLPTIRVILSELKPNTGNQSEDELDDDELRLRSRKGRSEVIYITVVSTMSRRASLLAKQIPEEKKPKGVRFPDELVFLDNIKENDVHALGSMLRRASLQVDISAINVAGLTPLHQAVLDGNEAAVRLLVAHGATVNKQDEDSWTPLHAACAEGHADIA